MAYIFTKIVNSIIMYKKEELPYKVKSYDLKNATLYTAAAELEKQKINFETKKWPAHYNVDDYNLVTVFVQQIVGEGLQRLLSENGGGQPYYYGLGRSRVKESCVNKLRTMVDIMLSEEADSILKEVLGEDYDRYSSDNCYLEVQK